VVAVEWSDASLMERAIDAARVGRLAGERARGAVGVAGDLVVVRHDQTRASGDPTAHAVALVLSELGCRRRGWRLEGVTVATTHEPCVMCAGALSAARVARLIFGAFDPAAGAVGSRHNIAADLRLGHEIEVVPGVLGRECAALG
jgi:tRNA(adenine34) deaminase